MARGDRRVIGLVEGTRSSAAGGVRTEHILGVGRLRDRSRGKLGR